MLDPKYLQDITKSLEDEFYDLETQILMDIAERIRLNANKMTSTASYQLYRVSSLGVANDKINSYLSNTLKISKKEVDKIVSDSSFKSIENDNLIFKEAFDKGILASFQYDKGNFKDLIAEGVGAMQNELSNICNTTAATSQKALASALNKAYLQISSGAFSSDQAVDNIVKQLSKDGLGVIEYKSGARRQLDTTVRTALRSSVNQTACKCQELNLDEMECNLVEVTSHLGARPEHAEWQGKIYWRNEPYKNYKNFKEETRYGYGDGLSGWNCRHSFYPYFPGISEKSFEHYNSKENNELYELQQEQRYNERMIRGWERRKKVMESAGLDTKKETEKVKQWKNINKKLIKSNDKLKHNYGREKSYTSSIVKTNSFSQDKQSKKNVLLNDRIPKEFIFTDQKESNLIDSYIEIDKAFIKDGKEHLSINDCITGKQLIELYSSSQKSNIFPSDKLIKYIEGSKDGSLVSIHNHPGKGTFSIDDIVTHITTKSFKESIVITNDAEIFFFSTPKGANIKLRTVADADDFKKYVEDVRKSISKSNTELSTKEVRHKAWIKISEEKGWIYGYKKIK